jgi:signal transduction histidine kinase
MCHQSRIAPLQDAKRSLNNAYGKSRLREGTPGIARGYRWPDNACRPTDKADARLPALTGCKLATHRPVAWRLRAFTPSTQRVAAIASKKATYSTGGMLRRISTKFSVSIAGVLGLTLLSSVAALMSVWQVGRIMVGTVRDNLPSFKAADDLEIALLEQRGLISSYILDNGNPRWTAELLAKKPTFEQCFAEARSTAITEDEFAILDEFLAAYRRYDAKRGEAVEVFKQGDAEGARIMLFRDVLPLHAEADRLSKQFKTVNVEIIDEAAELATKRIRDDTLLVAGCVVLTLIAGSLLFWQFLHGVAWPVKRMLVEAQGFAHDAPTEASVPEDDLHAVGAHLRLLMSDVTDARTTLEKNRGELRNAEKLASVGKLASSVAHEIRNPLTAIKMWLFWIREEVVARPEVNDAFDVVAGEVVRLEHIVRNFLEFTRPPELNLQTCDVRQIIELTAQIMSHRLRQGQIELVRNYGEAPTLVEADPQQLKQVLINLLDNAVEASPPGSEVEIVTATETDKAGGRTVVVRVLDRGPGVSPEVAGRILEPFFSTKEHGTGLGLCIAASIMARHGGRLALEPSAAGAKFAISIPLANGQS